MKSTLIIPAYKAAWCLKDCLESVADQTLIPDEIIIGVDSCAETAEEALKLVDAFPGLPVRIFFFAAHTGCYRIRNTMALYASNPILHLFDADDLMYTHHIETMQAAIEANRMDVAMGYSLITEEGEASRESGGTECPAQICLRRSTFIEQCGFEPWECAADSEFLQRGTQAGLRFGVAGTSPTFEQRKNPGSLTRRQDTNMRSERRRGYKAMTLKRSVKPIQLSSIAIGRYSELVPGDEIPECEKAVYHAPPKPVVAVVVCAVKINLPLVEKWKVRNKDLIERADMLVLVTHPRSELPEWSKVVAYTRTDRYSPAQAANSGIRWAVDNGAEIVVKTDIDCGLNPDICDLVEKGRAVAPICEFISAEGVPTANPGPCGNVAMTAGDWAALNGYDERQWGHGREDGELTDRALAFGIEVIRPTGLLYHWPHETRIGGTWYPRRRTENFALPSIEGDWKCDTWGLNDE